jgi:hypothetical protein
MTSTSETSTSRASAIETSLIETATAIDLNADCMCVSLDRVGLDRALADEVGDADFCQRLAITHPNLVSNVPVYMATEHIAAMASIITAIETVAKLAPYRAAALASAPAISHFVPGPIGVFMGYDFHLGPAGPQLIEINTNAGGALINTFVARAQTVCCAAIETLFPNQLLERDAGAEFVASFQTEWQRQRGDARLRTIALVDHEPETQYLYPEFVLFQSLFRRHGLQCHIAAPNSLEHRDGQLWLGDDAIDLVYNRSTDFVLAGDDHQALRCAYLAGDVVLTPNPWVHAVLADKRNLVRLTDAAILERWGVAGPMIETLVGGIPKTVQVTKDTQAALWAQRNQLFFKPASGYGSKAAYRGDKLTKRVWQSILDGNYVAQALVTPSARAVIVDADRLTMKVDVRNYTYDGHVQLVVARLYQGQTTNFRTPGGGFAPVYWRANSGGQPIPCGAGSDASRCC